jgi:hypothetical protein
MSADQPLLIWVPEQLPVRTEPIDKPLIPVRKSPLDRATLQRVRDAIEALPCQR